MSDIPRARDLLAGILRNYTLPAGATETIEKAIGLMTREPAIRRARAEEIEITPAVKDRVRGLSQDGYSQADIARITGLRNGGRVSEILNGKR